MNPGCPDLIALLAADLAGSGPELDHARNCAACSALLAEDRDLARSLGRLRDPMPPENLVARVMERVDAQFAAARKMRWQVLAVFGVVAAGFAAAFAVAGPTDALSHAMTSVRDWVAVTTAARALVQTLHPVISAFSVPLVLGQLALAGLLVLGITRLMPSPQEATP